MDAAVIAASGLFDEPYYRSLNADAASYRGSALEHFVRHGAAEGRRPNSWFDALFYLREYPDVAASRRNAFAHFLQHGIVERRLPHRRFSYFAPDQGDGDATAPVIEVAEDPMEFPLAEAWYDDETPMVSVIILNWNKSALTARCLTELWRFTTGHRYEIIVVDNGSRPEEVAALERFGGRFRLLRLPRNRFFGEGNNIAAERSRGRFLVFLNNDAFVTEDWLDPLMEVFAHNSDAGAVGPKFVYPDGRLQEAGATVDEHGLAVQFGKGEAANDPRFNRAMAVSYCSAACVVMARDTFDRALGFDLTWEPAYYEDSDLCLKIAQLGLKTYYCPQSIVVHIENATSSSESGRTLRLDNIVAVNRTKFVSRWGAFLAGRGAAPDLVRASFPPLPTRAGTRRRVALYTPYDLLPGGGEMYLLSVAATLAPTSEVIVVAPAPYSRLRLLTMARELNLDLDAVGIASYDQAIGEAPFDLSVVMANEIIPPVPGLGRRNFYMCQFPFPMGAEEALRRRGHWTDYQVLVVNSPFTRGHVQTAIGKLLLAAKPVHVVAPPVQPINGGLGRKEAIILGVGRFFTGGHCKRHDVMIEAFRRMVETTGLEAELHLVGALHPEPQHRDYLFHLQELAVDLPVVFHLNAARDVLNDLYRRALVYWHATGINIDLLTEPEKCEHFGITVVEAMSAGCIPVVPDRGGPAAVVAPGECGFHFASVGELAERTAQVLAGRDQAWVGAMADSARRHAADYDDAVFRRRWLELTEAP